MPRWVRVKPAGERVEARRRVDQRRTGCLLGRERRRRPQPASKMLQPRGWLAKELSQVQEALHSAMTALGPWGGMQFV